MKKIIDYIKEIFCHQKKVSVLEMMMRDCPEAVGPTGIIDLQKACDCLDKQRIRIIEQMIASKYANRGDIIFREYLDYECNPHTPKFYEDTIDYDFFIRGFCVIGDTVYIFDDECKRHLLTSMRNIWIEKFLKYINDENNLIFEK